MQWQSNRCHYIHSFLHANLICHLSTADPAHWTRVATSFKARKRGEGGRSIKGLEDPYPRLSQAASVQGRRKMWSKELVLTFNTLISSVRFKQADTPSMPSVSNLMFVFNEDLMNFTSEWCNACNMEATNHIRNKEMVFGKGSTEEDRGAFNPFMNVPMCSDLPMGMKHLHDAYLFIYIMCSFLAVFMKKLSGMGGNSQPQVIVLKFTCVKMMCNHKFCIHSCRVCACECSQRCVIISLLGVGTRAIFIFQKMCNHKASF